MRKRYSRSYTVLSFLTMFSYRELPFEEAFYRGKDPTSQEASPTVNPTLPSGIDPSLLKKISDNPDLLKILSAIAGSL